MDNFKERYQMRKREKGFTLIEVMVALFILTIGILAVASMQNSSLLGTAKSHAVTQATTVAMDRMERLLALPFTTWDAAGSYPTTYTGDDTFPLFTDADDPPPALPESVTSVTFTVVGGPVYNTATPPLPTTVTITVIVTPKGMGQVRLTGIKTSI
jgi:prepilin-type N-terminal cleavage/methylation domain-containing protein